MAGSCVPLSNGPLWERIQQLQLYLLVLSVRSHAGSFETITHALDLNTLVENHGHVNVKPTLLTIQQLLKQIHGQAKGTKHLTHFVFALIFCHATMQGIILKKQFVAKSEIESYDLIEMELIRIIKHATCYLTNCCCLK